MKLNYKNFEINVFKNRNYTLNLIDNLKQYEKVYFNEKHKQDQSQLTSKLAITIKQFGNEISTSIICGTEEVIEIYNDSFILEDDKIWILSNNEIYCLELPTLELVWVKEFDLHSNFSIYKLEEDFIIHGESQIFRISKGGDIIWSFAGRDIWFNMEGEPELTIEKDKIRLFDFESNEYVLDFDGNLIEDNPRIILVEIKKKWWKIFG
jgi:hypothetical protein